MLSEAKTYLEKAGISYDIACLGTKKMFRIAGRS